jgi:hypothetical protein
MSTRTNIGNRLGNATSRNASTVANYFKGTNKIIVALIGIFVLLVVGMIIYWIYQAVRRSRLGDDANPILVAGAINAYDPANAHSWKLPVTSGTNSPSLAFTLSFWMYIADWNYRFGDMKAIMIKGHANGNNAAPGLWLAPRTNVLVVRTRTYRSQGNNLEGCDVANIPLQKWVHVAYVLDNRVVDVYIDGKLERSCVLKKLPWLNNGHLHLIPPNSYKSSVDKKDVGFFGQLSSVRYFSSALRPVDVARLYNEGPNTTKGASTKDADGSTVKGDGTATCPTVPSTTTSGSSNLDFWQKIGVCAAPTAKASSS